MTIAITGASGLLGRLVIENFEPRLEAGELVALARNPSKFEAAEVAARFVDTPS
jgi:NAD(P)H dehydrogenase (quinone)